ncbi:NYN domain-containing protein [Trametes elegans]|nr:NYN domain-containing protein [Trametes elegans]
MHDPFDEHIAIFWDYENCTPPCNVPGYDVVNNIRQVAHEYGSVKLFKAYLELSEQSSSKSIGLRSELQSCGVSLTDCPHNGRKDVADKMMIVDMLTYAIDNPAPATIVLISGDRDFVYAVSVLRLRRYRVVVVAPYTAHGSLKSQASVVLDWEADIMRRTPTRPQVPETTQAPSEDALYRSPQHNMSFGGIVPQGAAKYARKLSFRTAPPGSTTDFDGTRAPYTNGDGTSQVRHFRTASTSIFDGTVTRMEMPSQADRPALNRSLGRPVTIPTIGGYDEDDYVEVDRQPIPGILDIMEDLQEQRSQSSHPVGRAKTTEGDTELVQKTATASTVAVSVSEDTSHSSPMGGSRGFPSTDKTQGGTTRHGSPSPKTSIAVSDAPVPVAFPQPAYEPPVVRPATAEPLPRVSSENTPSTASYSPLRILGEQPSTSTVAVDQPPSAPHCSVATVKLDKSPIDSPVPPSPLIATPVSASSSMKPLKTVDPNDALSGALVELATASVVSSLVHNDPAAPTVPDKFQPLVEVLQHLEQCGNMEPLRTTVALRLLQVSRQIYAQAGTASFKDYSTAAERAGVVTLGGFQGYAWISLKPEFRRKAGVLPAPPT